MLTSKIQGMKSAHVGARCVGAVLVVGLGSAGLTASSARAEDIGVASPANAPRSNVRSTRRPAPRPAPRRAAPRPTIPRPIQDETSPNQATSVNTMGTTPSVAPQPASAPARPASRRGQEEAVNLDALSTPTPRQAAPHAAPAAANSTASARGFHGPSAAGGLMPNFKFYYDFLLRSWKGAGQSQGTFSFESYHQRLLVEYTPKPELTFMADILQQAYFEMDYNLTERVQFRWGRIWIPFDDMSPHSVFGGRMNTSEFHQVSGDGTATEGYFLPNIWADLGIGVKLTLSDSMNFTSNLHAYIVNGFRDGGTSPVQGEGGIVYYPDFAGTTGAAGDNNSDKAIGARWHSVVARRFGFGLSVYRDAYTSKSAPKAQSIYMVGADVQLRPTNTTEIRLGYVTMKVGIGSPEGQPAPAKESFSRGGTYVELGQRFGTEDRWKLLLRAGASQNDNRVVDLSDKTIAGFTLLRNFGSVEAQLTYTRDFKQVPTKVAYNYGAFRLVTAF